MYKNILVPVSFEEGHDTTKSLEVAKFLADKDAKVTILHAIEPIPSYAGTYVMAEIVEKTREAVRERLEDVAKQVPGAQIALVEGAASRAILDWADENKCDLIVIASHNPGMADYLLGGTAARVVRHAHCSVHVVR